MFSKRISKKLIHVWQEEIEIDATRRNRRRRLEYYWKKRYMKLEEDASSSMLVWQDTSITRGDFFIEYNRVDFFCPWGPKIWPMEANKHIILYVIPSSAWGLLLCSRNFLYENNVGRYVLTLLSGDLSMILKLSCPSKKSSYFLRIILCA